MRIVSMPSFSGFASRFRRLENCNVVTFIENIMSHYLLRSIARIWEGVEGRKRRGRMEGNTLWGTPAMNNNYSTTPSWI